MTDPEARAHFAALLAQEAPRRLAEIARLFTAALMDNDTAAGAALVAERAAIQAVAPPADATREDLVALWPAGLGPLPLWFVDPAAAAAADPPGDPCVVDLRAAAAAGDEAELDPTSEAAILARRRERAPAEDAERAKVMAQPVGEDGSRDTSQLPIATRLKLLGIDPAELRDLLGAPPAP